MSARLALVLVVALGLTAAGCQDDDPVDEGAGEDGGGETAFCDVLGLPIDAALTPDAAGDTPDLIVFLEPDASQAEIDVVRGTLDEFGGLEITYVDQQAAFEEAQERLADDVIAGLRPEDLPSSFRVDAEDREVLPQVAVGVDAVPAVREVVTTPDPEQGDPTVPAGAVLTTLWYLNDRDVEVFVDPEVATTPPDELVELANELGDRVLVLDQEDTYEEFQRLFADSPQIVASVDPSILPSSVRFDVAEPIDVAPIEARAGVRQVVTLPNAFESILVDRLVAVEDAVASSIDEIDDDDTAADLRALLDAARTWATSDRAERTLGGVFALDERRRLDDIASRIADRAVAECGIDVDITSGVAGG